MTFWKITAKKTNQKMLIKISWLWSHTQKKINYLREYNIVFNQHINNLNCRLEFKHFKHNYSQQP